MPAWVPMGTAAESLTTAKQRRMVVMAEAYEASREDLPPGGGLTWWRSTLRAKADCSQSSTSKTR